MRDAPSPLASFDPIFVGDAADTAVGHDAKPF
jgi:hypothetical protein